MEPEHGATLTICYPIPTASSFNSEKFVNAVASGALNTFDASVTKTIFIMQMTYTLTREVDENALLAALALTWGVPESNSAIIIQMDSVVVVKFVTESPTVAVYRHARRRAALQRNLADAGFTVTVAVADAPAFTVAVETRVVATNAANTANVDAQMIADVAVANVQSAMSVTAIATNIQAVVPMLALQVIYADEDDHTLPDMPHEDRAAAVSDFLRRPAAPHAHNYPPPRNVVTAHLGAQAKWGFPAAKRARPSVPIFIEDTAGEQAAVDTTTIGGLRGHRKNIYINQRLLLKTNTNITTINCSCWQQIHILH